MAQTKRAQILMEPGEYQRLKAVARRENVSVAELIRRAVNERYLTDVEQKTRALDDILKMSLPIPEDWDTLEKEIADAHVDGLP